MTDAPAGRAILRYAAAGTLIAVVLVLVDLDRTGTNPLNLIQPGVDGPSVRVFEADFPDADLLDDTGLDGQQFYAVARNPFDLDEAAAHLDRPRYRLQRPLLSWLAWLGHPIGGGTGLIWSLFAVTTLATALLAVATGTLSVRFGGPAWIAALVGLYPGVWWSMRVSVADGLATALALAALSLLAHERTRTAVVVAVAAVLAKETVILVLLGWALAHLRERRHWYPVAVAGGVAAAWWLLLRWQLPGSESVGELTVPFRGVWDAVTDRWLEGRELWGLLGAATGAGAGALALARRGLRHPLGPAIALQFGFLAVANGDVIGNDFGSARAFLPVLALAVIALAAPGRPVVPPQSRTLTSPEHGAAGVAGPARTSGGSANS